MEWWHLLIGGMIVVLIAIGSGLFWLGNWRGKTNARLDSLEDWRKEFKDVVINKLDSILALASKTINASSPLHLNELGKKISNQVNADNWVAKHLDTVQSEVDGKTPYEIQQFCFDYVQTNKFEEQQKVLEKAAFDQGVPLLEVLRVIAIKLRDALLSKEQVSNLPNG